MLIAKAAMERGMALRRYQKARNSPDESKTLKMQEVDRQGGNAPAVPQALMFFPKASPVMPDLYVDKSVLFQPIHVPAKVRSLLDRSRLAAIP